MMNRRRLNQLLLALIVLESLTATWLLTGPPPNAVVNAPSMAGYHPYTARRMAERVRDVDLQSSDDLSRLATEFLAMGLFHDAESCCRSAVRLNPSSAALRFQWGTVLSGMGDLTASSAQLAAALEFEYRHPTDCRFHLAMNALRQQDHELARSLLRMCGSMPSAQVELARLELIDGQATIAADILQRVQEQVPNAWRVYHLQSQAARAAGQADQASDLDQLADLLQGQISSPLTDLRESLIPIYERMSVRGLQSRALSAVQQQGVDAARRLLSSYGSESEANWDPAIEDVLADLDALQGLRESQVRRLNNIIERDGPTSYRLLRLGFALLGGGQDTEAARALRQAVHLNSETESRAVIDAITQLAAMSQSAGDIAEASRWQARAALERSLSLLSLGAVPEALAAVTESTERYEGDPTAWFLRGELEKLTDQDAAAARSYSRSLALQPSHGRARQRLKSLQAGQRPE